ncbi:MAG: Zn-dependent membrane protease YugP [Akkermansiaceae bacterium]|jgi:Zn-dependent membrane protease YugP
MTSVIEVFAVQAALFGIPMNYWVILGGSMLLSWLVGRKLKSRFREHSMAPFALSGREVAERMLADAGIRDVRVISVPGQLTDHYNPADKTVNLSEAVFNHRNVAAAAVAAHECGHAVQHAKAYAWLTLRSAMVPVTNIASNMMNVIFMISMVGMFFLNMPGLLWLFVGCLAVTTLFAFITLPVEFDASKRALVWMEGSGIAASMDQGRARNALFWAAMTYVVAALSSLAMLSYYLIQMFGGSDD